MSRSVCRPIARFLGLAPCWAGYTVDFERVFNEKILSMCDAQILAGGGIRISGFLCLHSNLSAYHWRIMILLAWFFTISHITGFASVQAHLCSSSWKRNSSSFNLCCYLRLRFPVPPSHERAVYKDGRDELDRAQDVRPEEKPYSGIRLYRPFGLCSLGSPTKTVQSLFSKPQMGTQNPFSCQFCKIPDLASSEELLQSILSWVSGHFYSSYEALFDTEAGTRHHCSLLHYL